PRPLVLEDRVLRRPPQVARVGEKVDQRLAVVADPDLPECGERPPDDHLHDPEAPERLRHGHSRLQVLPDQGHAPPLLLRRTDPAMVEPTITSPARRWSTAASSILYGSSGIEYAGTACTGIAYPARRASG